MPACSTLCPKTSCTGRISHAQHSAPSPCTSSASSEITSAGLEGALTTLLLLDLPSKVLTERSLKYNSDAYLTLSLHQHSLQHSHDRRPWYQLWHTLNSLQISSPDSQPVSMQSNVHQLFVHTIQF